MNTPKPSQPLSHDQMHAILTDWHAHCVDDPLYAHLEISFEDMADKLWSAMKVLKTEQAEAMWADTNQRDWSLCQDMPGFAGTFANLGALNLQRVVV